MVTVHEGFTLGVDEHGPHAGEGVEPAALKLRGTTVMRRNSMLASSAPARRLMASPSPVSAGHIHVLKLMPEGLL